MTATLIDDSMLVVPIERGDGTRVTDLRSAADWPRCGAARDTQASEDNPPITWEDLLAEAHHRVYRQPWVSGRFRFEFLRAHGLLPRHRMLDIGCGAGRLAVWAIAYLEPERYFGVDAHLRSLVALSAYEMRLHGLEAKKPRLLLDAEFSFAHFGERFDVAIDSSVTRRLPPDRYQRALVQLGRVLAPGGRLFSTRLPAHHLARLPDLGFELEAEIPLAYPLGTGLFGRAESDVWHVLRLRGPTAEAAR